MSLVSLALCVSVLVSPLPSLSPLQTPVFRARWKRLWPFTWSEMAQGEGLLLVPVSSCDWHSCTSWVRVSGEMGRVWVG